MTKYECTYCNQIYDENSPQYDLEMTEHLWDCLLTNAFDEVE